MQTFMIGPNFKATAEILDRKRGFKQAVEAKQILCTLNASGLPEEWKQTKDYLLRNKLNHPAVQMWKGYEEALKDYYNLFVVKYRYELKYNTKMDLLPVDETRYELPWWMAENKVYKCMQARLVIKKPELYTHCFGVNKGYNGGEYIWPYIKDGQRKWKTIINGVHKDIDISKLS